MRFRAFVIAAALAWAGPLAAQDVPRGPHLLQVAASSGGVVLSIDSSTVARSGDSTFFADAFYQFPVDTSQPVPTDGRMESQEMDCAGMRLRGRRTTHFLGDSPVQVENADSGMFSTRWADVSDDERPIVEVLCQFLLGRFAGLPVTREVGSVDQPPELSNRGDIARELSRQYPRAARDAGQGGQVMLRFQITTEGRADMATARVIWATRTDFAQAALRLVRAMRFRPAKDHGEPLVVWVTIPVSFWLSDDGIDVLRVPERNPTGSPVWGGRSAQPTRPVHPTPSPVVPD